MAPPAMATEEHVTYDLERLAGMALLNGIPVRLEAVAPVEEMRASVRIADESLRPT